MALVTARRRLAGVTSSLHRESCAPRASASAATSVLSLAVRRITGVRCSPPARGPLQDLVRDLGVVAQVTAHRGPVVLAVVEDEDAPREPHGALPSRSPS